MSIIILESSHFLYILSAVRAWQKGYENYSVLISVSIALSMSHHLAEYKKSSTHSFDFVEGQGVNILAITTIIYFWKYFEFEDVLLLVLAIFFYFSAKFSRHNYAILHTLWHLITGYVIFRLIDRVPDQKINNN